MTAEGYVGASVLKRIITLLRATGELVDVQIETGWPGDGMRAESIYPGPIEADVEVPNSRSGTRDRDELLDIPLEVRVASKNTNDDTLDRLGEIIAAIDETIAQADTLDDHPKVVSAELTYISFIVGNSKEGYVGFADLTISVHTRVP